MARKETYGAFIQWNNIQIFKKIKPCNLQIQEWNWKQSPSVREPRIREKNITFFSHSLLFI